METTLQRHDVTILAERRRRHLIPNLSWGDGCRCCYDPNSDGGEYFTLLELRKEQPKNDQENYPQKEEDSQKDEESDDEFDYLLDEELPEDDGLKEAEDRRRAELEFQLLVQESAFQIGRAHV